MPHNHHRHDHSAHVAGRLHLSLALTLGYAGVELAGGLWSGSLALLSDAGHMFTDAIALGLAAAATWFAARPPSSRHSYGLGRAEVVAALLNALFMLAVVASIASEAWTRLENPQPVRGGAVMLIAGVGLCVNTLVAVLLARGGNSLNVRAALLHVVGDMLGSVAALAAGAVIYFTGWTLIDPVLALLVCALILFSTVQLVRESLHVMMEGVPPHLDLPKVGMDMANIPGVLSVHDLHIWTLASGRVALSAHVVLDHMHHWEHVLASLNRLLHDAYDIEHTTLQPETAHTTTIVHRMDWRGKQ